MVEIPVQLKESLKKNECALFAGAGLSEGLPTWRELVEPLAKELGVSTNTDFRITALFYENEYGRDQLEKYIVSKLQIDVPLPKTHEILPDLPFKAIITTNYDHLLEKAFQGKNVAKIVEGTKAPHINTDQIPLIKMHGDLDDPSSIIITEKDYEEYPEKHRALITYLKGILITCNFLFVGFSLDDPNFNNIYTQIRSLFGESTRKSYAIFKKPSVFEVKRWKIKGIEVISIEDFNEIPAFFEKLRTICTGTPQTKSQWTSQELENIQNTFREIVERQNKWLDPRGIFQFEKMLTKREVELERVYVVPRLVKQIIRKREKEKEEREKGEKEREPEIETISSKEKREIQLESEDLGVTFEKQKELTIKEAISDLKNNHMVIIGDPGVGKSCLLQYIALMASVDAGKALGMKKSVLPVVIPLREYTQFGQGKMLKEFIFHYIKNRICSLSDEDLEELLERNVFFFLFDGLDEVVSESERIDISRQVEQFMASHKNTRIILTSRPAGYKPAKLIGDIPHFTLAEFNDDEIKGFLIKWFTFLEEVEQEGDKTAEEKADNLGSILFKEKRKRMLQLARNPLLLTILVLIYRVGKKLPERRAEFYDYAIKTVAGTWENWKSLHTDRDIPDEEITLAILEKVGFKLHTEKPENTVQTQELKTWLKEGLEEELGHSSREEIYDFVWMLNERAGLLVERGLGLYGFVHLTFQEYFTARYIAVGRGTGSADKLIREKLHSSRWKEVFSLAGGIAPPQQADSLFESILHAKNYFEEYIHSNLLFAGEALADQPRVSESKRKMIVDELIGLTGVDNFYLLRYDAVEVLTKIRRVFQFDDTWAFRLLSDGYWRAREQAVTYFATIGAEDKKIKDKFFSFFENENRDVRSQAITYFTTIKTEDKKIKDKFFTLLKDKNWRVRSQAITYFTTIGAEDKKIKDKIFSLLKDENRDVREQAVTYFVTIGAEDKKIKDKFFTLLQDKNWRIYEQAVTYFTTIKAEDKKIKDKIFSLLQDKNWYVREQAVTYFVTIGAEDKKIKDKFFTLLQDKDWPVRSQTITYFTTIKAEDKKIKDKIFSFLRDKNWRVREQTVTYFTTIGAEDRRIKDKFFTLLQDKDWPVRSQTITYFTTIKAEDKKIKDKIFSLLKDKNWRVRSQAVTYFTTIGAEDTEIKDTIFTLLQDKNGDVRRQALEYLSKHARKESIKKAPKLFTKGDNLTKEGAYHLMKAILTTQ
jgi:HEAT repeat protein